MQQASTAVWGSRTLQSHSGSSLQEHVDDAVGLGAEVLCGGRPPSHLPDGHFFSPTLLGNATPAMRIFKEETFAPVIPLFPCASPRHHPFGCLHTDCLLYTSDAADE